MTLPIEYQNLIALRALEVVEPTPVTVDGFRDKAEVEPSRFNCSKRTLAVE